MFKRDELNKKKILTKDEASFYLGICNKTLTDVLMEKEDFPILRLGRRVFVHREKLDKWIDENTGR